MIDSLQLSFYDLHAVIQSDNRVHIAYMERLYHRFVKAETPSGDCGAGGGPVPVRYAIWTRSDNPWGQPVLDLCGDVHPLHDVDAATPFVYQNIVCDVLSRVRSHILFHAAVVAVPERRPGASGGRGVLLVGDSFSGKTTLALALVRHGFLFLSDETAALGRADRRVHPFPRSLRLRPGSLAHAGFGEQSDAQPVEASVDILDIAQLKPGSLGGPVRVGYILFLCDPEQEHQAGLEQELLVWVDRLEADLLDAIRQIEGVSGVRVEAAHGYPLLRLGAVGLTAVYDQLEALCRSQGVWVLDVLDGSVRRPSFGGPARLERIPQGQALIELLKHYQGGHRSAVLGELEGRTTLLLSELATIVSGAQCHRLYVGPVKEMIKLVGRLV